MRFSVKNEYILLILPILLILFFFFMLNAEVPYP